MLYVILLSGHDKTTPGKFSPLKEDGTRFYEYEFNHIIGLKLYNKLKDIDGIKPIWINPTTDTLSLKSRVSLVNQYCEAYNPKNCILVETHSNALGYGEKWYDAKGWSVFTTIGETQSDKLATCFYKAAEEVFLTDPVLLDLYNNQKDKILRKDFSDKGNPDEDYENNFYVIKNSKCASILIENFFYTNKNDLKYIDSQHGEDKIVECYLKGIEKWKSLKKL